MYPKKVVLKDEKLKKLLKEKSDLVMEGRALSDEILAKEAEMDEVDKQIQEIEKNVDNSDLKEKAKELTEEFNKLQAKMKELEKENYERMKQAVGTELPNKYEALKKEKEEMEKKRNKLALRVQKLNDKIIPIGRRLMKPYLEDEFDDYDTLRLEGDEIVGTIFNHLDDAEKRLRERFKKIIGN